MPEVKITFLNLSNIGFVAIDASMQYNYMSGSNKVYPASPLFSSGYGSKISEKPSKYVDIKVAKSAMRLRLWYSSILSMWREFIS